MVKTEIGIVSCLDRRFSCLKTPLWRRILRLLWRRAVAQLGSALEWGSRGRGFESRRPDHCSVNILGLSHLHRGDVPVLKGCW